MPWTVIGKEQAAGRGDGAAAGPDPPGIDCDGVAAWLDPLVGGLDGRLRATVIAGGRSNLTYVIADATRDWVLRRPPLAHVLPTAHDMAREHRVLRALGATDIPVPRVVGLCLDPQVLGVTFYVMERVHGHVLRDRIPREYPDSPLTRARISQALIRTLARLHAVEPRSVGLGDFGHPGGFLGRQVRRWWTQWEASRTRELPSIAELRDRLLAGLPPEVEPGIVHGDYRLDNVLLAPKDPGRIAAVLDWEMSTLGDPLTDLGLLLVYWGDRDRVPDIGTSLELSDLTAQDGFLTPDQLVALYARHSGRDLAGLDWYVALGYFKLAVVAEGIHARHLLGMTVGEGFESFGARVPLLVDAALERATHSGLPGLRGGG